MEGRTYLTALALVAWPAGALAEDATICADRPGKATSACTVPLGHWQVETGFADWTLQKSGGERDTSLVTGETLVKYGITASSDIEIDVTPWQRSTSRLGGVHDSASGFGDINIIYKQQVTSPGASVQVVVMPVVKAPTAKHVLGNGKWEGGLLLPIAYAIPKTPLSLGLTPEIDWAANGDGRGHHAAMTQVVSLGWQVNDRLNLSGELWGQWDWEPAGTTRQVSVDGAAAFLLRKDLQLDAGVNAGLNRETPDVEVYAGIARLF